MNLIGTIVVYSGMLALFIGGISILRPLRFLGIWSRLQGLILLVAGAAVFLIGASLPAREQRVGTPVTYLDEFVPAYQFGEFHSIRIHAPRERVYAAIYGVTANEIRLFHTLTWIRRFGRRGQENILNAPADQPLLEVMERTEFLKLAEERDREIVLGALLAAPKGLGWKEEAIAGKGPTPEDFKALQGLPPSTLPPQSGQAVAHQQLDAKQRPNAQGIEDGALSSPRSGVALAAMNFRLEDSGNGETLLTTETRVYASDESARKKFAAYWRVIYPGSALIRVMWLRAIQQRAEAK